MWRATLPQVWQVRSSAADPLPTLTFDEFESEIMHGRFRPVYLLYGPEVYLLRRALSLLKEKVPDSKTQSFNLSEYSARDSGVEEIVKSANTFPMMSPRRLVLVTDIKLLPETGQQALAAYVDSPQEKTVLVLAGEEIDRRTGFYRRLLESVCVVEFEKLKGVALERWAATYISSKGNRIASSSLAKLVDLAGSDLFTLAGEIDKLCLYAGSQKEIKDQDISALVQASRQRGIFDLTGAMGRKDRKQALMLLGNLLEAGEPPLRVITMMARHFRHIIIAKELISEGRNLQDIGNALQSRGYVLQELMKHAKSIDLDAARELYRRLALIDRSLKSTNPDERMLLEHLVCSL